MENSDNLLEKRYQQNPPNRLEMLFYPVLMTIAIFIDNELFFRGMNFLQINNSFVFLISYGFLVLFVFSLLYLLYCKMRNNKYSPLIINQQGINTDLTKMDWNNNIQVYEITDFFGSNLEKNAMLKSFIFFKKDKYQKAFLCVDKSKPKSFFDKLNINTKSLLITSYQWNIGDGKELIEFLNRIGQSVQPINSKQASEHIFLYNDDTDLGSKSGVSAYLSIGFFCVGAIISWFDNYRIVDFGNMSYLAIASIVILAIACFYWVKTNWKLWIAQIIVAVLFASTCTFMLGSILLAVSHNMGETKYHKFVYLGKVEGVRKWQLVADKEKTFSCKKVKEPINTAKSVETKEIFGMIRLQEEKLCSENGK